MEELSLDYQENVRWFNETLGVGRSCDMVSRDLRIGGRRARVWVVDGFGGDAVLERMGAFWLGLDPAEVGVLTEMETFIHRFVTFMEAHSSTRAREPRTAAPWVATTHAI